MYSQEAFLKWPNLYAILTLHDIIGNAIQLQCLELNVDLCLIEKMQKQHHNRTASTKTIVL